MTDEHGREISVQLAQAEPIYRAGTGEPIGVTVVDVYSTDGIVVKVPTGTPSELALATFNAMAPDDGGQAS